MTDTVTFDLGDDAVGTVRINRPDKLNAMNEEVFEGLHQAAAEAAQAAAVQRCRAVLLTGAGRAFSAGLDVSMFGKQASGAPPSDDEISYMQQAFTVFEDLPVPSIAAVKGPTLGAGAQLAIACNLRVSAGDLSFGLLEAKWGLLPDLGGTWRLPRLVGLGRATDLAITARKIDADTAARWGLVNVIFDEDDFDAAAHRYVAAVAAGPTVSVGAIPKLMRDSLAGDRDSVLSAERQAQQRCLASSDFREAAMAGLEGRAPNFTGR